MRRNLAYLPVLVSALGASTVACSADGGSPEDQAAEGALMEEAPSILPEPTGPKAKHAFVLAHGLNGSTTNDWAYYGVAEALRKDHPVVVLAEVPPFQGAKRRAEYLAKDVDRAIEECKRTTDCDPSGVNLIAHSMGGLDARAYIGQLHGGDKVKSLTTIASPHRGSAVIDMLLGIVPHMADGVLDAAARMWGRTFTRDDLAKDADVRAAFDDLAEANADSFAAANPMDTRVYVQSYAGVSSLIGHLYEADVKACDGNIPHYKERGDKLDLRLAAFAPIVGHGTSLLPNDGMVAVANAKLGEFKGCIPANHYSEIGQPKREGTDSWSGFDHVRFYRTVAFDLAKRGF